MRTDGTPGRRAPHERLRRGRRALRQDVHQGGDAADLFEVVKEIVECELGLHRAGLMLAMVDLGSVTRGVSWGAYFVVAGTPSSSTGRRWAWSSTGPRAASRATGSTCCCTQYLQRGGHHRRGPGARSAAARLAVRAFGAGQRRGAHRAGLRVDLREIVAPAYGFVPPASRAST